MAESFSEGYDRVAPLHVEFGPKVESLLGTLIENAGVAVLNVTHRVKKRESALRKASNPSAPMSSIGDLHDLLGLRVITYFADDVDRVAKLIESEFEVQPTRTKDKRATLDPDRFGYLSVHYGARISKARRGLSEWTAYSEVWSEIQIRSALQHAWAEIEHDLGYKSTAGSVPAEFRRRFSRLAGMLELADEQFESLRDDLSKYELGVTKRSELPADEINQVTMASFVRKNTLVRKADEAIAKGHGAKLVPADRFSIQARAEEFVQYGMKTLGEVERALRDNWQTVVPLSIAWFNDVADGDGDEDDEERGEDGHYTTLPRGISLFYLWRHLDFLLDENTESFSGRTEERFRALYTRVTGRELAPPSG